MRRHALFVPVFIAILIALSAAIAVGAYGVRVAAVRRGIARALEQFDQQETGKGFSQLARLDCWSGQHPAFISQVRCAAIIGHVLNHNDAAALELADRELRNDRTPPPPSNAWQVLFQLVSEQLDPLWLKEIGGRAPDPAAGYRALLHAVDATGDEQRLASLKQQLDRVFGEAGLDGEPRRTAPGAAPVADALAAPDFGEGRFAVAAGATIRCYNEEGKHCGDLVPGALVTVTDTRESNGGEVAVCLREDVDTSHPLLVRTRDLLIRNGDLARLPADVRSLLVEHGRATSRLREARQRAAGRNPHAEGYRKATAEYKAFVNQVKQLTAARDKAEGAERTRVADELQQLKNKAPELRDAYETTKRNYEEWKASHAGTIDDDPEVATLRDRVDNITRQLAPYFDT